MAKGLRANREPATEITPAWRERHSVLPQRRAVKRRRPRLLLAKGRCRFGTRMGDWVSYQARVVAAVHEPGQKTRSPERLPERSLVALASAVDSRLSSHEGIAMSAHDAPEPPTGF
jgi:hypothetical protein